VIVTDRNGAPLEKPTPTGTSLEARLLFIRQIHAYNDRIADCACGAFDRAFREALKER